MHAANLAGLSVDATARANHGVLVVSNQLGEALMIER
jgi:hypothetical protein